MEVIETRTEKTAKNHWLVPRKQWNRWSRKARETFNDVYGVMADQRIMTHPKAKQQSPEHWETVRWNAAWLAADAMDGRL